MTTQIKAGVIAANAVNSSELASGALSGQNFTGDVTFDTTTLVVDSTNNRVGVGTASPDANLEVITTESMSFASDTVNSITLGTSGTNKPCIKFDTASTTHTNRVWAIENGAGERLNFFRNGLDVLKLNQDGSVEIPGSIINSSAGATVATFEGNYSASGDVKLASFERIGGAVAAAIEYNDATTDMEFGTTTSHALSFITGDTRRVTINSSGNIGIGQTSPYFPLHVEGASLGNGEAKNNILAFDTTSATTGTGGGIAFGGYSNGTGGDIYHFGNIQGIKENSTAGNYASAMLFSTRENGATPVERMRIDSSGNVGIGNLSPSPLYWPNGSTGGLFLQAGGLLSAYNAGTNLSQNYYYNSGEKFIGNGGASRYVQSGQEHIWSNSTTVNSSGAGANLTWTESMRINSSGQVGIACTDQSNLLTVDANSASVGTDSVSVRNRGVSSVNHTTGLRFQFVSAVPSAIRSRLLSTTTGAGTLSFYTSADGSAGNLTERMTIDNSGNIDIGGYSLNSSTGIELKGSSGQINHDVFTDNTATTTIMINSRVAAGGNACLQYRTNNVIEGSILGSSTGLAISNVSDYRKKQNIRNLTGSLDIIKSLQPRVYNYKEGFAKDTTKDYVGFIAHELSEYIPDSVIGTKDEVYTQNDIDNGVTDAVIGEPKYQSVLYSSNEILTRLVQSIQEQQTIIDDLKSRLDEAGL